MANCFPSSCRRALFAVCLLLNCDAAIGGDLLGFSEAKPEGVRSVAVEGGYLVPFKMKIPGSEVAFEMLPVPGGVVRLGPAEGEAIEADEEGIFGVSPNRLVRIDPFWIGKHEVTWAEYRRFMKLNDAFTKLKRLRALATAKNAESTVAALKQRPLVWNHLAKKPSEVDGVTSPTPLYYPDVTYESGEDPDLPAVSMTQFAARQYTKWLSRTSGIGYRLPSEAEWEHAARGGTSGASEAIDDVAWHEDNSEYAAQSVGKLRPNAWGLHDMLGNAAEWVLDAPGATPSKETDKPIDAADAIVWPTANYPRIAKGGYWDGPSERCAVASRLLSAEWWKEQDPNLPKSPWWFADAPSFGVGFRVMRPYKPMNEAMKKRAWEIDSQGLRDDVENRLTEGRGKREVVDRDLPAAIEQLDSDEISGLIE